MDVPDFGIVGLTRTSGVGFQTSRLMHGKHVRVFLRIYLTNRFHVAVRLFNNRSQMTSKWGKNKKVAHEA